MGDKIPLIYISKDRFDFYVKEKALKSRDFNWEREESLAEIKDLILTFYEEIFNHKPHQGFPFLNMVTFLPKWHYREKFHLYVNTFLDSPRSIHTNRDENYWDRIIRENFDMSKQIKRVLKYKKDLLNKITYHHEGSVFVPKEKVEEDLDRILKNHFV